MVKNIQTTWFDALNSKSINLLWLSLTIIGLDLPYTLKIILWGFGGLSIFIHLENDRVLYFGERDKLEIENIKRGLPIDEYEKLKNSYSSRQLFYRPLFPFYLYVLIYALTLYQIMRPLLT